MYISILRKALPFASFVIFSAIGNATPLTWTLNAGSPTTGPVGGTFTYDAETNQVVNWDLGGFFGPGCAGGPPCGGVGLRSAYVLNGGTFVVFFSESRDLFSELHLELSAPLTDAGGTISLIPGSCTICGGPGYFLNPDFSGSGYVFGVVSVPNGGFTPIPHGTVSAAPEPEYGLGIAMLLLATAVTAHYKPARKSVVMGE